MADTANDLFGVLDALKVERAHLVGLSYGGGIVQAAAVRRPDRVESQALLSTTDYPLTPSKVAPGPARPTGCARRSYRR